MQRKDFLKMTTAATAACFINTIPFASYAQSLLSTDNERVLVLLHLKGGNDGLNTVIPLDTYSQLSKVRPNLIIPEKKVLRLKGATGLHPAMELIQELYKEGFVKIIQGVGIADGVYAHARATQLWLHRFDIKKQNDPLIKESLQEKLSNIAQHIATGVGKSTYVVTLDGFDTHVQQMETHHYLLATLSAAVASFMSDCKRLHIEDKVAVVAFSEFGRRVKANDFGGTDHGTAQPVVVFGKNIRGGIVGDNPILEEGENNLIVQYDYSKIPDMIYV